MDHQPGHLFGGPGIDKYIAGKPVHQEETEARRLEQTANDANQTEYQAYLLVQGNKQQVVVPGLTTTRDLLLLDPIVEALPDAISNTALDICEENGKQDQENRPGAQDGKEPVRPWHRENGIQHTLLS